MAALCEQKTKVIAIGGPTATGKTALSVRLAQAFGGEVIGADSMQLYRGLDVGTAKATPEEQCGIPHHLIDVLEPAQVFSVADYVAAAQRCVEEIAGRGRLPLVVGGTGLYITSLLSGLRFAPEKTDPAVRAELERRAAAGEEAALYEELCRIDPTYAAGVHPNNRPRVLRALELYQTTGKTMTQQRAESRPEQKPYDSLCLCLACRDRTVLYGRIDARCDKMLAAGILAEAESVWRHREAFRTAAQAIGYKEFFPYFEGTATLDECMAQLKQASRNYAKRQLTWFKHQTDAVWLYADEPDCAERALALAENFLK